MVEIKNAVIPEKIWKYMYVNVFILHVYSENFLSQNYFQWTDSYKIYSAHSMSD